MALPSNIREAMYLDSSVANYRGNPLIEALPSIMSTKQIKQGLSGNIIS